MPTQPTSQQQPRGRRLLPLLSTLLVILVALWWLRSYLRRPSTQHQKRVAAFNSALRLIPQRYVGNVDESSLHKAAMEGMVKSLGDPYSAYLDPQQRTDTHARTEGEFGGIGVMVAPHELGAIVVEVKEDAPAEAVGVKGGDLIVAVQGVECAEMSVLELVSRIRGEVGTSVSITLERAEGAKRETVEVTRARIRIDSVEWRFIEPHVGYIQIHQFNAHSFDSVRKALEELKAEGDLKALLLDVRGNTGGLLEQTVEICDLFLAEGIIARVDSPVRRERKVLRADPELAVPPALPMAVLVDGQSASASEILAGALKSHGRATVIGMPTFGKGAVNRIYPLPDDSGIVLTVAHYVAGEGTPVEGKGIEPDLRVGELPPAPSPDEPEALKKWRVRYREAHEEQLQQAVEFLKEKIR